MDLLAKQLTDDKEVGGYLLICSGDTSPLVSLYLNALLGLATHSLCQAKKWLYKRSIRPTKALTRHFDML